ncbi:hypothetical protein D3C86_1696420 [compost metagenome]
MLDEDHHHGVEHAKFALVGKPREQLQERHLSEVHFTDDLFAQVQPVHHHLSRAGPCDVRFHFTIFHGRLSIELLRRTRIRDEAWPSRAGRSSKS